MQLALPDSLAWEESLARLTRLAVAVLRGFAVRPPAPDEVASEVLLRLLDPDRNAAKVLRTLQAAGSPEAYLNAAIRNAIITGIRKYRVERRAIERLAVQQQTDSQEVWFAEDVELLTRELHRLTSEERELLRLRFWNEQPIADIARHFNLSYSATAVKLFRLLRKLRAILVLRQERPF